eukprot:6610151-Prorocentrum_lima.AAC.1
MTSSLVGSEMCIRDRPKVAASSCDGSGSEVDSNFLGGALTLVSCDDAPVSYTHLTLPTICSV